MARCHDPIGASKSLTSGLQVRVLVGELFCKVARFSLPNGLRRRREDFPLGVFAFTVVSKGFLSPARLSANSLFHFSHKEGPNITPGVAFGPRRFWYRTLRLSVVNRTQWLTGALAVACVPTAILGRSGHPFRSWE